jgi:2,4-dienoyl-CoA reductase-like NADH-dependent reductase (Old Yellow Enzyme family)
VRYVRPLSTDHELEPLWQPLPLRGATLANRVMCTATTLQYGRDGLITDRHLAFYRERARGGVGLLFSEQLTATRLGETAFPNAIAAYDDRQVSRFAALAAELASYETRFFAQLVASGAKGASTLGLDAWGPVRAPSRIPAPGGEVPLPLGEDELAQIAADFAHSARNVREGGLDGVEVHGAHGWLVGQFLSRFYNHRTDGYGGSLENRCRLALQIGRAVRAAVGDDFPVGLALTYDEAIGAAGITPEDTEAQLEHLAAAGVYDFFDLSIGAPHSGHLTISPMSVPEGYALPFGARAKRVVGGRAAVFVAGRVVQLEMAARAVVEGAADVVGMTRAHLADPHLIRKARSGQGAWSTRCVGANVCVGRALAGTGVACVVNPVTGREARWGEGTLGRVAEPRRVVVVGAGPAGLRVAATAAGRGHDVVVHEREREPGGHLRTLAWLPTRGSWLHAVEDLVAALERGGGELRLGSELGVESVVAAAPDVVVLATGAEWDRTGESARRPDRAGIPGASEDRVIDLGTALARARDDPRSLGRRVVIADEAGSYAPLGLAEALATAGVEVELATPAGAVGSAAAAQLELPHVLPRLARLGVTLTVSHDIAAIEGGTVVLRQVWGGPECRRDGVDTVVLAIRQRPRDELLEPLRALLGDVRLVGDARSPRPMVAVIEEAEALGREL